MLFVGACHCWAEKCVYCTDRINSRDFLHKDLQKFHGCRVDFHGVILQGFFSCDYSQFRIAELHASREILDIGSEKTASRVCSDHAIVHEYCIEVQIGELKVGGGSPRQMNQQQAVHTLPVFVEDHKISESPVTSVGGDLFQGEALQMFAYGPSLLRG
jgi:hypothetical protein